MRKVSLNRDEGNAIYTVLNNPANPQAGLSIKEVRKINPILDKIEGAGEFVENDQGEFIKLPESFSLELKESEYTLIKDRIENSGNWVNASIVRKTILPLIEKLEESEKIEEEG